MIGIPSSMALELPVKQPKERTMSIPPGGPAKAITSYNSSEVQFSHFCLSGSHLSFKTESNICGYTSFLSDV